MGRFAQRSHDFVVTAVADEHDRIALFGVSLGLQVDLSHQRAGGINDA